MGQYFVIANHTKCEYISGKAWDTGNKLFELAMNVGPAAALIVLLSGRWKGDVIAVHGDEAFDGKYHDVFQGYVDASTFIEVDRVNMWCSTYREKRCVPVEVLPQKVVDAFLHSKDDVPRALRHAIEELL